MQVLCASGIGNNSDDSTNLRKFDAISLMKAMLPEYMVNCFFLQKRLVASVFNKN